MSLEERVKLEKALQQRPPSPPSMKHILKKRLWIGGFGALVVLAFLLTDASVIARTFVGYLPVVGPPPLRLWLVTTNVFSYSRFNRIWSRRPKPWPPQTWSNQTSQITSEGTNYQPSAMVPESSFSQDKGTSDKADLSSGGNQNITGQENEAVPQANITIPRSSVSDLLTVTPQMIAQYLKPLKNGTNSMDRPGAVVFIPAESPLFNRHPKEVLKAGPFITSNEVAGLQRRETAPRAGLYGLAHSAGSSLPGAVFCVDNQRVVALG